jgi:uncharacterized protein
MINKEELYRKISIILSLIEKSPSKTLGRTAIVKLLYLLQEIKNIPLGYDFRLYTYGPFDSDILCDLEFAQSIRALKVKTVIHSSGYSYNFKEGNDAITIKEEMKEWLLKNQTDIKWVSEKFGGNTASDLELIATILYVDRELAQENKGSLESLAQRVREVKPRFTEEYVLEKCHFTKNEDLLCSVS